MGVLNNIKILRSAFKGAKIAEPEIKRAPLLIKAERAEAVRALDPTRPPTPAGPGKVTNIQPDAVVNREAATIVNTDLDSMNLDRSFQPNFDMIETTDDIKSVIAQTAEKNQIGITAARRGKITNDQLMGLSNDLDIDVDVIRPILERESGGTLNAETIVASRQVLNSSAERILGLAKKIDAGQATDEMKLQFRRQMDFHKEYMQGFMGARAETGRALHAFGIKIGSEPENIKRMAEVVETMHGRDITKVASALAKVDSLQGVNKLTRELTRSKVRGVVEEVFINSILSGIKTHVINTTGNALFQTMNIAETAVAARIGRLFNDAERMQIGEASAQLYGMLGGFRDGLRMMGKTLRTATGGSVNKFESAYPKAISAENLELSGPLGRVADLMGNVIRAPTERALAAEDDLFKSMAYRSNMHREALRRGVQAREVQGLDDNQTAAVIRDFLENPTDEMRLQSDDFALYATFQNPLGETGRTIQGLVNKVPGLKMIAPFIRTPTNLFKGAFIDRTPIGLFSKRIRDDIAAGGARRDMVLARVSMGSLTAASVALAVSGGVITGGGPSNFRARKTLEATGWRPYSMRTLNPVTGKVTYNSYARAEPLAFIMGAVADAAEMSEWMDVDPDLDSEAEVANKMMASIVGGIADNTMSKTFLSGLSRFNDALMDPDRHLKSWMDSMTGALIPYSALRRDLTRIQDPVIRQAWTLGEKLRASSGIPGWSEQAPAALDIFAEERHHPKGTFLGVVSPFPEGVQTTDPVRLEVARLLKESNTVPLSFPSRRIEGLRLSVQEYHDLVRSSRKTIELGGLTFHPALKSLMSSELYKGATIDTQSTLIKSVQTEFDQAARALLERNNEDLGKRLMDRRLEKARRKIGDERVEELLR